MQNSWECGVFSTKALQRVRDQRRENRRGAQNKSWVDRHMKLRNNKEIGNRMENWKENEVEELEEEIEEQTKDGVGETEKLAEVMKWINQKINKEIRDVRKELKGSIEEIRRGIREERARGEANLKEAREWVMGEIEKRQERFERKLGELTEKIERKQMEGNEGVRLNGQSDHQESIDKLGKEMEDNRQYMGMIFEKLDTCQKACEEALERMQGETEKIAGSVYEKLEDKLAKELSKFGNNSNEGESKRQEVRHDVGVEDKEGAELVKERNLGVGHRVIGTDAELPKFDNRREENPRRFFEDFEEFTRVRGIDCNEKIYWLKRCLGESTRTWFEVVGRGVRDFQEVKRMFLERYWGPERQAEVIRKLYTPGTFTQQQLSREQYLLAVCKENQYLDSPLSDRILIGAVSRQMGTDIARHVMSGNISKMEDFVRWVKDWEDINRDPIPKARDDNRRGGNSPPGQYYNNWREGPGRRRDEGRRWNERDGEKNLRGKERTEEAGPGVEDGRPRVNNEERRHREWNNQGRWRGNTEASN